VGVQQAAALSVLQAGGQHPPLAPIGAGPLRRRPRPRPPARTAHRRARLVPDRVALLAGPDPLRPGPATAAYSSTSPSPSLPPRAPAQTSLPPSGWPAPPSPEGRPAGPSAKRLTTSRHPLPRPEVDTGRLLWRGDARVCASARAASSTEPPAGSDAPSSSNPRTSRGLGSVPLSEQAVAQPLLTSPLLRVIFGASRST
jgi:hypothetical protein